MSPFYFPVRSAKSYLCGLMEPTPLAGGWPRKTLSRDRLPVVLALLGLVSSFGTGCASRGKSQPLGARPLESLTQLAEGGDVDAVHELQRRTCSRELSRADAHSIAEVCLDWQARDDANLPAQQAAIEALQCMFEKRLLAADQVDRYFRESLGPVEAVFPALIAQGDDLCIDIEFKQRLPLGRGSPPGAPQNQPRAKDSLFFQLLRLRVTVGDTRYSARDDGFQCHEDVATGIGDYRATACVPAPPTAGRVRVTWTADIVLHDGAGTLLWSTPMDVNGWTEIAKSD
jgi:hypothetical protein